jgi:hypothetical protein
VALGFSKRAAEGETVCGDAFTAEQCGSGVLVGVVDGLGHGPLAASASEAFIEVIREDTLRPLDDLMSKAHERLSGTRGAAAALLRIDASAGHVEFTGVGNIHMHSVGPVKMKPVCVPGVVGHRIRKLRTFEFELPDTMLIAVCSDGISSGVRLEEFAHLSVQEIAESILETYGRTYDDATCVVARYAKDA